MLPGMNVSLVELLGFFCRSVRDAEGRVASVLQGARITGMPDSIGGVDGGRLSSLRTLRGNESHTGSRSETGRETVTSGREV